MLDASGVTYDQRQFVRGFEPAEDLISVAESNDAEMIVIGLRRRTPVGKLILGFQRPEGPAGRPLPGARGQAD